MGSGNQFLKISNCLKTFPPGAQSASLSTLNFPQGVLKCGSRSGRVQSPQRQMANTLAVVQSLADALGECQLAVDTGIFLL